MSDTLYQVILLPLEDSGTPYENVRANLSRAFQVEESTIDILFDKTPTVIKSGVDMATAEVFRDAIIRSGAACEVREQPKRDVKKSPLPGKRTTIPTMSDEPQKEKILAVLKSFQPQASFHVHPKIPETKLKNAMERMAVLAADGTLTPDLLPPEVLGGQDVRTDGGDLDTAAAEMPYREAVTEFKKKLIGRVLAECSGNQTKAAERLGLQRSYLNRMIKDLDLRTS